MAKCIILMCLITLTSLSCSALAFEVSPLQDFCVADTTSTVRLNGLTCKNPLIVEANDFYYNGLNIPSNKTTQSGIKVTPVNVAQIPGLNTLGMSMTRIDYVRGGVNPPHIHPRATEMLVLLEGSLHVGFVTSYPENRLISRVIHMGDVFVFPVGLVHFQRNVGYGDAVALLALSSQNPGFYKVQGTVMSEDNNNVSKDTTNAADNSAEDPSHPSDQSKDSSKESVHVASDDEGDQLREGNSEFTGFFVDLINTLSEWVEQNLATMVEGMTQKLGAMFAGSSQSGGTD